jgi:hypothetical protein
MFKGIEMILAKNERTHMLGERMRDEKGKGEKVKRGRRGKGKEKRERRLFSLFRFPLLTFSPFPSPSSFLRRGVSL